MDGPTNVMVITSLFTFPKAPQFQEIETQYTIDHPYGSIIAWSSGAPSGEVLTLLRPARFREAPGRSCQ